MTTHTPPPPRATRTRPWRVVASCGLVAVAIAISVLVVKSRSTSNDIRKSDGPPVPSSGAYVGAWVTPDPFTQPGRVTSFQRFEREVGHSLDVVHLYRRWGMPFGTSSDEQFARSGKYLLVSWALPQSREIASGVDDPQLREAARQLAALPTKIWLEPRWEMDRPGIADIVQGPNAYVAAWDHVRQIFAEVGPTNIAWTWCPTAVGFDLGRAAAYYPGDDHVDWICADIYPTKPWETSRTEPPPLLGASFMTWASHHDKPIIIGELAVDEAYEGRRARWILQAARWIRAHKQIKAVLWFEQSSPDLPPFDRWAVASDPPALSAFARLIARVSAGRS